MKSKLILLTLLLSLSSLTGCGKPKQPEEESESPLSGTIAERLEQLDCIDQFYEINHGKYFKKVYNIRFTQYIDHNNKALGTFTQHIELGFNDLSAPTVYVSSGYMIQSNNSSYPQNENELAFLLNCNYLFVEHRYFGNSLPVNIDYDDAHTWDYLNTQQAASDAHNIVKQFKRVLEGKWLSTGMSKGGMTTELYAYYYPGDMDLYVPYVAPFCNSFYDERMVKFINEEAGDVQYGEEIASKMREDVLAFQIKLLEYRDTLAPRFYNAGNNYSSYATVDSLYDAAIIEFGIGFWQYYQEYNDIVNCLNMEETTTTQIEQKQNRFYYTLTSSVEPNDLSVNNAYTPYYIQAYQELGNYCYDYSYIREALPENVTLSVKEEDEQDLAYKLALSDVELGLGHKELIGPKINEMLKTTKDQFIMIYGSSDPWYAVRPDDVKDRDNVSIYVNPHYPHTTNISNFDEAVTNEILTKIKTILDIN